MGFFSVFLISAFTLTLEFLQTRILSVVYWYHLAYFIITLALLGISFGGLFFYLSSKIESLESAKLYGICLIGFGCSAFFGTTFSTLLPIDFFNLVINSLVNLFISYLLILIPYFFFGLLIISSFKNNPKKAGLVYFHNLLGSAFGCWLYILGIKYLGASHFLLFIFLVTFIFGLILIKNRNIGLPCLVILFAFILTQVPIRPEKNKQFWTLFKERIIEFSLWNPIAKVDVISGSDISNIKRILIDGDAQSPLVKTDINNINKDTIVETPHREVAYIVREVIPLNSVLIIGSGGGADVITAYKNGAQRIDAVEINSTIIDICKHKFSSFIGNIFNLPNINLYWEDGRSYIERSKKKYDVILLFAVDSLAALNSGVYILSENYLYTKEAFSTYWDHLSAQGILQISRWYYPSHPRETLRVFSTVYEVLKSNQIEQPYRHILVVGEEGIAPFANTIVSFAPFTEEQIKKLKYWLDKNNLKLIFSPYELDKEVNNEFVKFVKAASLNKEDTYMNNYVFDIRPVNDDRPFFFQYGRWFHIFKPYPVGDLYYDSVLGRWPFLILFLLLFFSITFVNLLLWIPFLWKKKREIKFSKNLSLIIYFSLIALGFIFIEITLIQKFTLVLGHPIYSMAVVIPAILFFSSLGSLFSKTIKKSHNFFFIFVGLFLIFIFSSRIIYGKELYKLFEYSLRDRITLTILTLAPLSFIMGIFFPLGIRKFVKDNGGLSLAWITNGGFSVIGSILVIIIALISGFKVAWTLSFFIYLISSIIFIKNKDV